VNKKRYSLATQDQKSMSSQHAFTIKRFAFMDSDSCVNGLWLMVTCLCAGAVHRNTADERYITQLVRRFAKVSYPLWYAAWMTWKGVTHDVHCSLPSQWALQVAALAWSLLDDRGTFGTPKTAGVHMLVGAVDVSDMTENTVRRLIHLETFTAQQCSSNKGVPAIETIKDNIQWGLGWMAHFMLLDDPALAQDMYEEAFQLHGYSLAKLVSALFVSLSNLLQSMCTRVTTEQAYWLTKMVCLFYDVSSYGGTESTTNCCSDSLKIIVGNGYSHILDLIRFLANSYDRDVKDRMLCYQCAVPLLSRLRLCLSMPEVETALANENATAFVKRALQSVAHRGTPSAWLAHASARGPTQEDSPKPRRLLKHVHFSSTRRIPSFYRKKGILDLQPTNIPQTKQTV
jgi:hypothetical protein